MDKPPKTPKLGWKLNRGGTRLVGPPPFLGCGGSNYRGHRSRLQSPCRPHHHHHHHHHHLCHLLLIIRLLFMWNKDQPRFARVDTPCDSCVPHQGWISLLPKLGLVHFLWDREGSWLFVCRFNEPIPQRKQLLIRIEEYLIICVEQSDQTMCKWGLEQCYCESPGPDGFYFFETKTWCPIFCQFGSA